jgi:hypothetical protein
LAIETSDPLSRDLATGLGDAVGDLKVESVESGEFDT